MKSTWNLSPQSEGQSLPTVLKDAGRMIHDQHIMSVSAIEIMVGDAGATEIGFHSAANCGNIDAVAWQRLLLLLLLRVIPT